MKILITGASGFLGGHLIDFLHRTEPTSEIVSWGLTPPTLPLAGREINHENINLLNQEATQKALHRVKPDEIYHFAGTARVSADISFPDYFQHNFLTSVHIVEAIQRLGISVSFLLASTAHVYGVGIETVDEESALQPTSPYGFSKLLAEGALTKAPLNSGRRVIARLSSCIGPRQAPGFVASDFAEKIRNLPQANGSVLKTGPLDSKRQFFDVRDAVQTFPRLLRTAPESSVNIYNIASPRSSCARDILEILLRISGKAPKIQEEVRPSSRGSISPYLKVDKLLAAVDGLNFRPLESTLRDVWNWELPKPA